jgi:uncharacterized protein YdhG (YjbR/CyaY superfamily)
MSATEVDRYLSQFDGPGLATALDLRKKLLELITEGEEGISYAMPVIKLNGKAIAGYAIAKNHVGYYPHSSLALDKVPQLVGQFKMTKGAMQIPHGEELSKESVEALVLARIVMLGLDK